jgi:hypothetical protein
MPKGGCRRCEKRGIYTSACDRALNEGLLLCLPHHWAHRKERGW